MLVADAAADVPLGTYARKIVAEAAFKAVEDAYTFMIWQH